MPEMWRIPSKLLYSGLLRRKKEYEKIGLCCPSSTCDYIEENLVNLTEKRIHERIRKQLIQFSFFLFVNIFARYKSYINILKKTTLGKQSLGG
jgi:hypothetical protein